MRCDSDKGVLPTGRGFVMPAEWEKHEATFLAWPHCRKDWPGKLSAVGWAYGEIVRKICPGEIVRILVQSAAHERAARAVLAKARADLMQVEFHCWPTNRAWVRDYGPICVRRLSQRGGSPEPPRSTGKMPMPQDSAGQTPVPRAIVKFKFTAWGYRHRNWQLDNRIPLRAAEALDLPLFPVKLAGKDFALEGGGLDVNGRGTLLTTEECFLDQVTQCRNPGAAREDYEAIFRDYLGATNVLWLARGLDGDDTHGHVDDICRFVAPDTVVLAQESNPADANYRPSRENRQRLGGMRLENGSRPKVVELPMPQPLYHGRQRLPASYANFYIANAVVLVPTFNDPADRLALGILAELLPGRCVVGIHALDLVLGGGSIHCLTQQQPAPSQQTRGAPA